MLSDLIRMFPDFKKAWESDNNYQSEEWGIVPYHGLFSEFSRYFLNHFSGMSEQKVQEFCDYIEQFVRDDEVDEDIDNAICTCFLENVRGEPSTVELPKYLGAKSLKFYKAWHGV